MNLNSAPVTKLIGGLALVVVAALGWFLLVGPTLGQLGEVGERRSSAEDRSNTLSLQLAQLRAQADDLPQTRQQAAEIADALPATADQPGFFAAVNDAATKSGIDLDQVTDITQGEPQPIEKEEPGTEENGPTIPEALRGANVALQLVTVSVEADYRHLTRMVRNIEAMDRVLFMSNVDVSSNPTSDSSEGAGSKTMLLTITGVAVIAPEIESPDSDEPAGDAGAGGAAADGGTDQASG